MAALAEERLARLLALLPWLRAHADVEVAVAAAQFGISEAQLRQDVRLLWYCGLPGLAGGDLIDVEFEGGRIRVLDAQTLDRPLRLTGSEGVSLLAAARALRELPGLTDPAVIDRVLAKLAAAVSAYGDAPEVALRLTDGAPAAPLAAIRTALADGRRLHLTYLVERRDEMTERTVDPLELRLREGHVYLHAWDGQRGANRTFRLDRVERAVVAAEAADPPPRARADLVAAAAGFAASDADAQVRLALEPPAHWVADYYPVEDVAHEGDRLLVTLRTPGLGWVARLAVRTGGAVRVRGPAAAVAQVRRLAEESLAAYAD